jgi:hypothetical protein
MYSIAALNIIMARYLHIATFMTKNLYGGSSIGFLGLRDTFEESKRWCRKAALVLMFWCKSLLFEAH